MIRIVSNPIENSVKFLKYLSRKVSTFMTDGVAPMFDNDCHFGAVGLKLC